MFIFQFLSKVSAGVGESGGCSAGEAAEDRAGAGAPCGAQLQLCYCCTHHRTALPESTNSRPPKQFFPPAARPCLLLPQLVELVKAYCQGDFSEEVVKANFVLIYELLDEVLDYGYPQLSDPAVLKSLIFQKGFVTEARKKRREAEAANATLQVRRAGCTADWAGLPGWAG